MLKAGDDRAGIKRRRFPALRHSAATIMLATGTPLEVISNTLGTRLRDHGQLADNLAVIGHRNRWQLAVAIL
jgi:integrase